MRLSRAFLPTLKEVPSDASAASHVMMLRAGMVRQLVAGIYSHLPFGWTVMQKIMQIVREEMNAIGGQEFHLPAINPLEVWQETGRADDFGDVMFRFRDRKNKSLCLAPTHEEVICSIAKDTVRSYRDMPQIWYQIQWKFRDEERPRGGVLRGRQFLMKDAYTLNADEKGLDVGYNLHSRAYENIFSRCGLNYFIVGASSGLMGGTGSQEFMVPSISGEDRVARCEHCGYSANVEVATSKVEPVIYDEETLEKIPTPGQRTIEALVDFLSIPVERTAKSRVYIDSEDEAVLVLVRGDYEVNDEKLLKYLGAGFRPAHPEEVLKHAGAEPGSIGPVGFSGKILVDYLLKGTHGLVSGANEDDFHYKGISVERDAEGAEYGDLRVVVEGDLCPECGNALKVLNCIELGHIFKLGTKYSVALGATFLDESGKEKPVIMGSYGIGIERIAAAAIEQDCDDNGIVWPLTIAPFQVHLLTANANVQEVSETAEKLYKKFLDSGVEVLFDDRDASAGFKFKDADLVGIPFRVVVGAKGMKRGVVEISNRRDGAASRREVAPSEVLEVLQDLIAEELKRLNSNVIYKIKPEEM